MKKLFLAVLLCSFAVMCNQNAEAVTRNISHDKATLDGDRWELLPPFAEIKEITINGELVTRWAYVEYTENLMKIFLYDYNLVVVKPGDVIDIEITFKELKDSRFSSEDVDFYAWADRGGIANPIILASNYINNSFLPTAHYSIAGVYSNNARYEMVSGFKLDSYYNPLTVEVILPVYNK